MTLNRRVFLLGAAVSGMRVNAADTRSDPVATTVLLAHSGGRETSYRMMIPPRGGRLPVVVFSHGANSSNEDYDLLWQAWASRGYCVIGPNHIDSGPVESQRKVARSELWPARMADATLPMQQPGRFDAIAVGHGMRIDWRAVCAAGHSFGAVVAQSLAGASILNPGDGSRFDGHVANIKACIALSPPGPLAGFIPNDAWAGVAVPSLLQTGDRDVLPGFVDDWHSRLTGFPGRPDRWTIVGRGVDHYFGGLICRRKPGPNALLPALEQTADLCALFLDAYLGGRHRALSALRARAARADDGVLSFESAAR